LSANPGEPELVTLLRGAFPGLVTLDPAETRRRLESFGRFAAGAWSALPRRGIAVPEETHATLAPSAARAAKEKQGTAFLAEVHRALGNKAFLTFFWALAQEVTTATDPAHASSVLPKTTESGRYPGDVSSLRELAGYEILSLLGEGAMGRVYKARQKSLERMVALKVLTPRVTKDQKYIERFHREARLAATLTHQNVVLVIDQGTDAPSGLHYIAFELVEGTNLEDELERRNRFPEKQALEIGLGVARALAAAHHAGIVHRDVKPANILLTHDGIPKLCDLGLARVGGDQTTGKTVGTPLYMPPEQLQGADVDHRADLYALGLTLHFLLTGKRALAAKDQHGLLKVRLEQSCPDPRKLDPALSEASAAIVMKLAAREPEARYASAADAVRDLESAVSGRSQGAAAGGAAGIPADPPWTFELLPLPDGTPRPDPTPETAEQTLARLDRTGDPKEIERTIKAWQGLVEKGRVRTKAAAAVAKLHLLAGDKANAEERARALLESEPTNRESIEVLFRAQRGDAERARLRAGLASVCEAIKRDLAEARSRAEKLRDAFPQEPHPRFALLAVARLARDERAFNEALQDVWNVFPSKERSDVGLGGLDGLVADLLVAHGRAVYGGDPAALRAMLDHADDRSNLVAGALRMGIGVARIALTLGGLTALEQRRLHFAVARGLAALRRYQGALDALALALALAPGERERALLEAEKAYVQQMQLLVDPASGQRRAEVRHRCAAAAALVELARGRRELAARERAVRWNEVEQVGASVLEAAKTDPSVRSEIQTAATKLGLANPFEQLDAVAKEFDEIAREREFLKTVEPPKQEKATGLFGKLKSVANAAAAGVAGAAREAQLLLRENQVKGRKDVAARRFAGDFAQKLAADLVASAKVPQGRKAAGLGAACTFFADEEARATKEIETLGTFA
jgi:serine/threonine-protein kinase